MRELCTTLLNCYLIQLLETGFLHADPHPGNLIRTPDGKICILDFGLMTEVSASPGGLCDSDSLSGGLSPHTTVTAWLLTVLCYVLTVVAYTVALCIIWCTMSKPV